MAMPLWLAFRHTFCSSFSRSWTRPRSLCFLRRGSTTSLRSFGNCIGWEPQSGSSSSSLFWCTSVCTGRHSRTSPTYLADKLQCSADSEARRRLRSTSSSLLTVLRTWLSTVGDRAFPVAAARTASTRHVCTLYVCFSRTPGGFPLQVFPQLL